MGANAPLLVRGATAYPASVASARVRLRQHRPLLAEHGVDLRHLPTLSDAQYAVLSSSATPRRKALILARSAACAALATRRRQGLLLLHRLLLLTPFPHVDPPPRIDAYDFDDALFIGAPAAASARFQWLKREAARADTMMRRARLVIAANNYLADHARTLNRNVEVVPSCVDPSTQAPRDHRERELVTIGWIGSHTTVAYLAPVLPVIARLHARGLRLKLVVIGGDTGMQEPWLEHRAWSLDRQGADLAAMDIGIMPLPDSDWARGKAGYKLLQYFSAAVPAIASPVGVNVSLLADGRGLLATTAPEWERALMELAGDAAGRGSRGAAAREFVEREYSYRRWSPELAAILHSLA